MQTAIDALPANNPPVPAVPVWKELDLLYDRLCRIYDRVCARGDDAAVTAMGYLRTIKIALQAAKRIEGL